MDKNTTLKMAKRLDAEKLLKQVLKGVVTLDELREIGLQRAKQDYIKKHLEEEEEAWINAQTQNSIYSYNEYLSNYPKGLNAKNAENAIGDLRASKNAQKNIILQKIKNNEYTWYAISDFLDKNIITKADLVEEGILTDNAINLYQSNWTIKHDLDFSDLPTLQSKRTDIYFFGIPRSGKSSLLAGLLFHTDKIGKLELDVHNKNGFDYASALIECVKDGHVPPSTPTKGVNYITAALYDDDENKYPLNLIEMSGELFTETYKSGTVVGADGALTIGANKYLKNDNKKIIFFVVDYKETVNPEVNKDMVSQSAQLNKVLALLEQDGTIKKTDAIFIVLTKSDLMDGGAQDKESANNFINEYYRAFRNRIKRLKSSNGTISTLFKPKENFRGGVLTFSLGKFMLDRAFEYDQTCSNDIYSSIVNNCRYIKK